MKHEELPRPKAVHGPREDGYAADSPTVCRAVFETIRRCRDVIAEIDAAASLTVVFLYLSCFFFKFLGHPEQIIFDLRSGNHELT
jgi:hypothetical protein